MKLVTSSSIDVLPELLDLSLDKYSYGPALSPVTSTHQPSSEAPVGQILLPLVSTPDPEYIHTNNLLWIHFCL